MKELCKSTKLTQHVSKIVQHQWGNKHHTDHQTTWKELFKLHSIGRKCDEDECAPAEPTVPIRGACAPKHRRRRQPSLLGLVVLAARARPQQLVLLAARARLEKLVLLAARARPQQLVLLAARARRLLEVLVAVLVPQLLKRRWRLPQLLKRRRRLSLRLLPPRTEFAQHPDCVSRTCPPGLRTGTTAPPV